MPTHPVINSVKFCAVRLTRLNPTTLAPVVGATNGYVSHTQIKGEMQPQYETTDEQTVNNGCDAILLQLPEINRLKGRNVNLTFGAIEAALLEMATGGELVVDGSSNTIGYSFPDQLGPDATDPPLVGVELWSKAYTNSQPISATPYVRWIFPAVLFTEDDDAVEADSLQVVLNGVQRRSDAWPDEGPYADQDEPVGAMGGWLLDSAPPASSAGGYVAVPTPS